MATSLFPVNKLYQSDYVGNENKVAAFQFYIGVFFPEVYSVYSSVLRNGLYKEGVEYGEYGEYTRFGIYF